MRVVALPQGVDDLYTDPQIHTVTGKGFGRGNLGQAGLNAFLARHKCNSICEHLGLQLIGGEREGKVERWRKVEWWKGKGGGVRERERRRERERERERERR